MTKGCARRGFTTIELMVVLMIAAVIVGTTVPAILPALRKNAVNRAASTILAVGEQARRLARSSMDTTKLYGVKVDGTATPAYVTITYNDVELLDPNTGTPVMHRSLGGNAAPYNVWTAGSKQPFTIASTVVSWYYEAQTGMVVKANGQANEVGSGTGVNDPYVGVLNLVDTTPPMTVAGAPANVIAATSDPAVFGVCSIDGQYGIGIVIFNIGIGYSHEITQGK